MTVSKTSTLDQEMLRAALSGYTVMLQDISKRIAALQRKVSGYKSNYRSRYRMSPEAKKRVSDAQKKRWKQYRIDHA